VLDLSVGDEGVGDERDHSAGGLFVFYGVVVTVTGFVDSAAAEDRAAGIDINVWSGVAMLVFGIGMLGWLWLSRRNAARGESTRLEDRARG
jgi:hypothetical protein